MCIENIYLEEPNMKIQASNVYNFKNHCKNV